ncbi:unnamed protein product, partial [Fusarium fujikuroi]
KEEQLIKLRHFFENDALLNTKLQSFGRTYLYTYIQQKQLSLSRQALYEAFRDFMPTNVTDRWNTMQHRRTRWTAPGPDFIYAELPTGYYSSADTIPRLSILEELQLMGISLLILFWIELLFYIFLCQLYIRNSPNSYIYRIRIIFANSAIGHIFFLVSLRSYIISQRSAKQEVMLIQYHSIDYGLLRSFLNIIILILMHICPRIQLQADLSPRYP